MDTQSNGDACKCFIFGNGGECRNEYVCGCKCVCMNKFMCTCVCVCVCVWFMIQNRMLTFKTLNQKYQKRAFSPLKVTAVLCFHEDVFVSLQHNPKWRLISQFDSKKRLNEEEKTRVRKQRSKGNNK